MRNTNVFSTHNSEVMKLVFTRIKSVKKAKNDTN